MEVGRRGRGGAAAGRWWPGPVLPAGQRHLQRFRPGAAHAEGFVTVRVAALLETPTGKKLLDKAGDAKGQLKEFEDKLGLSLKDVERFTLVAVDAKKEVVWGIVQTSKALDKDKILKAAENPAEKSHAGKKYYLKRDNALAFIGDKLLVGGPEAGVKKCLEMKKPGSGPLSDALKMASKKNYQIAGGINVTGALAEQAAPEREGRRRAEGRSGREVRHRRGSGERRRHGGRRRLLPRQKHGQGHGRRHQRASAHGQGANPSLKNLPEAKPNGKAVEMSWKIDSAAVDSLIDLGLQLTRSQRGVSRPPQRPGTGNPEPRGSKLTENNVRRLGINMTLPQVEAIFGPGRATQKDKGGDVYEWSEGRKRLIVTFTNGKLTLSPNSGSSPRAGLGAASSNRQHSPGGQHRPGRTARAEPNKLFPP